MNNEIRVERVRGGQAKEPDSWPLRILYELDGVGLASCTAESEGNIARVFASYSSDALRDLVLSALCALSGFRGVEFSFEEEPGQYRWIIEATGHTTIDVRLVEFSDTWSNAPPSEGSALLLVHTNRFLYAEAVRSAASAVLAKHDLAGYRTLWHAHPFPAHEFELLKESLASFRHGV